MYLAQDREHEARQQALDKLPGEYHTPLQKHLQHKFGVDEDQAMEWVHSFIEKGAAGRFRWGQFQKG